MDPKITPDRMLHMADAGRSWSNIAHVAQMPVRYVKDAVEELKAERRKELARTPVNESARGLLEPCHRDGSFWAVRCRCPRKFHTEEGCTKCGPERDVWHVGKHEADGQYVSWLEEVRPEHTSGLSDCYALPIGCNGFVEHQQLPKRGWRRGDATSEARARGYVKPEKVWWRQSTPDLPQTARIKTQLRRLKRKQKEG